MISAKNAKEKTYLLRVSAAIVRETQSNGKELLVIKDDQKIEVSAGFKRWSKKPRHHIWSIPGGMRLVSAGKPQTREQVLQQSLQRETGFLVSLQALSEGKVQKYPFLLGRRHPQIIERVASTSALFYVDQLASEYQKYIDKKIKEQKALWYSLAQIATAFNFNQLKKGNRLRNSQSELDFRQHVYTSAYLWSLSLEEWSDEAVLMEVNRLNSTAGGFIGHESKKKKLPLGQSIFGGKDNITVPYMLPLKERQFLYNLPSKQ